ncbi:MAG: hypothetical protein WBK55_03480 [Alphaproteobacteria bacterium]
MIWTEERRQRQREIINRSRPWGKSTGPKSRAGKLSSSLNALKHGERARALDTVRQICRKNREFLQLCELYSSQDTLERRKTNELIENRLKSKRRPHPLGEKNKRTDDH